MRKPAAISKELISDEDWEKTPEAMKRLVEKLLGKIEELERKQENLEEKLGSNSQNTSIPPSTDKKKEIKPKKKPSGKSRGGQLGHSRYERKLYPVSECVEVVEHYPLLCIGCGEKLEGEDKLPYRHQIVEIPIIKPEITEHKFHQLECKCCGKKTKAWNQEIVLKRYGVRIVGHIGLLMGMYRQSTRMVQQMMEEVFGIPIAIGTLEKLKIESSLSLATQVEAAKSYVQQQKQVNIDETGFTQGNSDGKNPKKSRAWLWTAVTEQVSYFQVALSRGQEIAKDILGEKFGGIIGSDRCGCYNWVDLEHRQVCWAHLKRDFQRIAERSGASQEIGINLLKQEDLLFNAWYQVRDGISTREELLVIAEPIRADVKAILTEVAEMPVGYKEKTPWSKTVRTCRELLKVESALWTFVEYEGIEPTNNAAERALRPAVLWRKNSFGSQSEAGSLFVARMMTIVTSLRTQGRNVLEYLVTACQAARHSESAPSILPLPP